MEQAARARLEVKRQALLRQRGTATRLLAYITLINCLSWMISGIGWLIDRDDLNSLRLGLWSWEYIVLFFLLASGLALGLMIWLPRGLDYVWRRRHVYISRMLRDSAAGPLLLQPELWVSVQQELSALPLLKFGALASPGNLEQQAEFAAVHWRVLVALTHGQRGLRRAVVTGTLLRLSDRLLVLCFNRYTLWAAVVAGVICFTHVSRQLLQPIPALRIEMLLLSFLILVAIFALYGSLLVLAPVMWYMQSRAAHVAMIDFLLE